MRLPKHKCGLHLEHNDHRNVYESVEDYIESVLYDWQSDEQKMRAIATDELWTLQWYPDTPIGSYSVAAPTLAELLSFAAAVAETEDYLPAANNQGSGEEC